MSDRPDETAMGDGIADAVQIVESLGGSVDGHALDAEGVSAHGALGFGRVIMMHGDYYGPVINLAARLVGESDPGQILTDAETAAKMKHPTGPCGPPSSVVSPSPSPSIPSE